MKEKIVYLCDNCGKEFESHLECEKHEVICDNKHKKFRDNVEMAVGLAKKDFGTIIKNISFKTDEEVDYYSDSCGEYELYKFEINIELSNGNIFSIYDGSDDDLWLGNYLETEVIYKSLKREIENRLETKYEGIISWNYDDGWRRDFLGEISLGDIVDRLNGRKVKLEVID